MDVNAEINYILIWLLTIAIEFSKGKHSLFYALPFNLPPHCNISSVYTNFKLPRILFFFFIENHSKTNLLLLLFEVCLVQMGFIDNQIYLQLLQYQMDLKFLEK
jgi:hypothetical protein